MNINAFISLWLEDEEENYEDSLKIFENFYVIKKYFKRN